MAWAEVAKAAPAKGGDDDMLLRTRIILFVLAVVTGVAAVEFMVGWFRLQQIGERIATLEIARVERAWSQAVREVATGISAVIEPAANDERVIAAVRRVDPVALNQSIAETIGRRFSVINVYGADGDVLLASGDLLSPTPLIGANLVTRTLRAARDAEGRGGASSAPSSSGTAIVIGGARVLQDGALGVVGSVLVGAEGGATPVGMLAAAVPLRGALDVLRGAVGGTIFATDATGRLVTGNDGPLWRAITAADGAHRRHMFEIEVDEQFHEVVVLPVADLMGGRLITLTVVSDVTEETARRHLWEHTTIGALLLVFVAAIGLLYMYMRHNFATVDDAVSALHQLARGGRGGYVELPAGNDEIGRIAEAVEVFGQAVREIERSAHQRERRQGRQQRFIRRQMEQLASTLEDDARRELLAELAQMEAAAGDPASAQSKAVGDELGLIALGFSRLATKVSVQQVQLTQLVRDLREALEDKRKLISLQQELEIAANMQLSVLPREFPESPNFDIAASMDPAKEVGGDFYDVFEIGEDKLGVAIADVSGKGIPAAFFMLISRTMLRALAGDGYGPAETLARLNNLLSAENEQMMFVTVFYAEIDRATGTMIYCNGGHNPPYVARADGRVEVVENTPGIALATFPDLPYGERSMSLGPGDTLFLYTDGVTEAFAPDNVAMFGEDRLEATLAEGVPADAAEALERVMAAVAEFTTGAEQSDDITGVALHWRGADQRGA